MKKLNSLFRGLVYVLPAVLFFSYHPVISLGTSTSMNFELSLTLVWLVIFDLVSFCLLVRKKKLGQIWKQWKWLLFPVFLTVSVFWSLNFMRGLLTVGILWLLYFAVFSFYELKSLFKEVQFYEKFWGWFLGSTLFVCAWCLVQCVLDLAGVGREYTLMCAGCTYQMFGFPHPNGFAIEPQFMGNLLIAPAITLIYVIVKDDYNSTLRGRVASARRHGRSALILGRNLRKPLRVLLLIIFLFTLFLTLSRGAIYAFVVGAVFMSAMMMVQGRDVWKTVAKRVGVVWGIIVFSFLFTLNLQGVMAQVSSTNDTYMTGVTKVLNHLSLGVVDVREKPESSKESRTDDLEGNYPVENSVENLQQETAVFDGYVVESTEARVKLTDVALKVWSKDFTTVMFGVGLGGAGQALYVNGLMESPKEIVQNQYAGLLLETGIVGVLLMIFSLVMVAKVVIKNPAVPMILTLMVTYGVTLCFFSGLPNALQIYLLPSLLIILMGEKSNQHR